MWKGKPIKMKFTYGKITAIKIIYVINFTYIHIHISNVYNCSELSGSVCTHLSSMEIVITEDFQCPLCIYALLNVL